MSTSDLQAIVPVQYIHISIKNVVLPSPSPSPKPAPCINSESSESGLHPAPKTFSSSHLSLTLLIPLSSLPGLAILIRDVRPFSDPRRRGSANGSRAPCSPHVRVVRSARVRSPKSESCGSKLGLVSCAYACLGSGSGSKPIASDPNHDQVELSTRLGAPSDSGLSFRVIESRWRRRLRSRRKRKSAAAARTLAPANTPSAMPTADPAVRLSARG